MKKFFLLGAIALLGLASACVEQIQVNNPNYDAEKGTVKTQFVINVANTAQTKATAANVQATADNTFLGMEGIRLFMSDGYGSAYLTDYVYDLGAMTEKMVKYASEKNLTEAEAINADDSRRIYEMVMPTGVDNMVFYAKAPTTTGSDIKYPFNTGETTSDTPADPTTKSETNFELVPITKETTVFTTNTSATALLGILNAVAGVTSWYTTEDVTLATALHNFVNTEAIATSATATTVETLRQGSAAAVLRTMQDLYNLVKTATEPATGTTSVAWDIKSVLLQHFTAADDGTLSYTSTDIKTNFPANLGLPVGAAQVKCTVTTNTNGVITNAVFSWVSPSSTLGTVQSLNYANVMYPPVLCYWADSPIRVSNTEGVEDEKDFYPNGVTNWNSETAWTSAKGNWLAWATNKAVTKDTRAVALKNNVLYGTALAKYTVALKAEKLMDNQKALVPHLSDQEITVASKFKVKGILIGGQPNKVAWNFIPYDSDRSAVIYDNVVNHTNAITTSASNPFYTMVFDNYNSSGTQDDVVFALELENNAGDFYGKDNIIYDGGTFYLCGKMKKSDLASTYTDLTTLAGLGYRIPPLDDNNDMAIAPRIFMQDFVTTVTITLGDNALKSAYATIPDLRPINMYFGLSVDLSWKAGAALSVEL